MQYIKSYAFIKRTCLLLSPLFLVTLASKELAFYSPAATLSPIFGGFSDDINSIRKLEAELGLNQELDGIQSYGDLMIQKTSGSELWIEQQNPLAGLRYGQDFKYEKIDEKTSGLKIKQQTENKYQIDKVSFDASDLKDKGGLSLLTVFDLNLDYSDSPVPITHVAPLSDLISVNEKDYSIVKVEDKDAWWWTDSREEEYRITLKKNEAENSFSIELSRIPSILPSTSSLKGTFSSLTIKSFYILYNDDPPLDPQRFFSSQDSEAGVISDISSNPRARKVFLNRWKKKDTKDSKVTTEPAYTFDTGNNFWKSACEDPYKVGGFIDTSLAGKPNKQSKEKLTKKGDQESASKKLEKQNKTYVDFRADVVHKEPHQNQYYWKDFTKENDWVPSDDNDESWNYPCTDGIDEGTKQKFKEYLGEGKILNKEPEKNKVIQKSIIPKTISEKLSLEELRLASFSLQKEGLKYESKIIQSAFRAWGNVYNTKELSGDKIKEAGRHNSSFERAVKREHKFEISINKNIWKRQLINNSRIQDNKNKPDISSVIEVNYPISFEFYDPISNYLRKHKLLLKTELDLRNLYLQSHYSKEVFRFDIGRENKKIGEDYQGFDPIRRSDKKKEYGLDGIFSLIAGLELDIEKNLKISLIAQTSGFVNTKNPSCDLRHRLYKIDSEFKKSGKLDGKWNCSDDPSWKYRDYIHIPSFLVVSLTGEPEVTSFYVDNNSGLSSISSPSGKDGEQNIKTLGEFESKLVGKEIIKVFQRDESNNGEIYFEDIAAYKPKSEDDLGEELQLTQSGWLINSEYQYIYYYTPRRQENEIKLEKKQHLKKLKLHIGGSKYSNSQFFHSGHFNTIKTLCLKNKHSSDSSEINKDCADGKQYEEIYQDKKHQELTEYTSSQILEVDWSTIKDKDKTPLTINFRTVLNRASIDPDTNTFSETKTKLEELFKGDKSKDPDSKKAAMFSLLAVWYSIELWIKDDKLHYVTKIRPISMVSEKIGNANAQLTSGASGSAGFQISKLEFIYTEDKKAS